MASKQETINENVAGLARANGTNGENLWGTVKSKLSGWINTIDSGLNDLAVISLAKIGHVIADLQESLPDSETDAIGHALYDSIRKVGKGKSKSANSFSVKVLILWLVGIRTIEGIKTRLEKKSWVALSDRADNLKGAYNLIDRLFRLRVLRIRLTDARNEFGRLFDDTTGYPKKDDVQKALFSFIAKLGFPIPTVVYNEYIKGEDRWIETGTGKIKVHNPSYLERFEAQAKLDADVAAKGVVQDSAGKIAELFTVEKLRGRCFEYFLSVVGNEESELADIRKMYLSGLINKDSFIDMLRVRGLNPTNEKIQSFITGEPVKTGQPNMNATLIQSLNPDTLEGAVILHNVLLHCTGHGKSITTHSIPDDLTVPDINDNGKSDFDDFRADTETVLEMSRVFEEGQEIKNAYNEGRTTYEEAINKLTAIGVDEVTIAEMIPAPVEQFGPFQSELVETTKATKKKSASGKRTSKKS